MLAALQRMFDYETWALRRVLSAIRETKVRGTALDTYAHILNAYQIWHDRIDGVDGACSPWQNRSTDECVAMLDALRLRFETTLEALSDDDLERVIEYKNTKRQEYAKTLGDILTHVALHSAYHRGQVNTAIRQSGGVPAVVDFIAFDRKT